MKFTRDKVATSQMRFVHGNLCAGLVSIVTLIDAPAILSQLDSTERNIDSHSDAGFFFAIRESGK